MRILFNEKEIVLPVGGAKSTTCRQVHGRQSENTDTSRLMMNDFQRGGIRTLTILSEESQMNFTRRISVSPSSDDKQLKSQPFRTELQSDITPRGAHLCVCAFDRGNIGGRRAD